MITGNRLIKELTENMDNHENKRYTLEEWYELELPEGKHVELIDGVLYDMATPTTLHQRISGDLFFSIESHIRMKNSDCIVFQAPFGVQLDENEDTIVEPDIAVVCDKDKIKERGCVGAPDWIIEIISPSTASVDYLKKRELYIKHGVREYWIVDPGNRLVFVYKCDKPEQREGYSLDDTVVSGLCSELSIDFKKMMERIEGQR